LCALCFQSLTLAFRCRYLRPTRNLDPIKLLLRFGVCGLRSLDVR
jgi:hypothetical protein